MINRTHRTHLRGRPRSTSWRVQVKQICRQLGEFSYVDVRRELLNWAYPTERPDDMPANRRRNLGGFLPTDRQLIQHLERAPWCYEIEQGDRHHNTRYRYGRRPKVSHK